MSLYSPEPRNEIQKRNKKTQQTHVGLKSRILTDNLFHTSFIGRAVLFEEIVCIGLGGRFRVRVVQQILDTEEDLLDRDGRFPGFFFVQDRETDGAGGVHVRVKERRDEFAYCIALC